MDLDEGGINLIKHDDERLFAGGLNIGMEFTERIAGLPGSKGAAVASTQLLGDQEGDYGFAGANGSMEKNDRMIDATKVLENGADNLLLMRHPLETLKGDIARAKIAIAE